MTRKEILTVIKESAAAGTWNPEVIAEVQDFCDKEIAGIDRKAAKAKEKAAQKRAEGDAMTAAIKSVLTDDFETIASITAKVDFPDVTSAKVSVRLNQLFKNGEALKDEVNVAEEGQKARKLVAYKLA